MQIEIANIIKTMKSLFADDINIHLENQREWLEKIIWADKDGK